MINDTIGFGLSQVGRLLAYLPYEMRKDVVGEPEELRQNFVLSLLEREFPLQELNDNQIKDVFRALNRAIYLTARFKGWRYTRKYGWLKEE
ncbi:hypothetical protein [Atrimonas thermophila]|uniref:hypothetical protein n=1 Tax=Atrimonas thermophila TaxID=3064161 RepID=UPI00399CC2C3